MKKNKKNEKEGFSRAVATHATSHQVRYRKNYVQYKK